MKQINNTQTKDYIAEAIRNEILSGGMEAGEELTQEALAEMLGVSRMPVREALQTLVSEGFVERLPNRHMQVVALDKTQIAETFRAIAALEAEIAGMLIEKGTDLEELEAVTEIMEQTDDKERAVESEIQFHSILVKLLDNKYLAQTFDKLMRGYITYAILNPGDRHRTGQELLDIKIALQNGEQSRLGEFFRSYYNGCAARFE